ncbi:stromal interaction molecule homolog isoform X4 [Anopheles arabiensis]|uniref:stromal interaction molecule homolog isoform X4 n=1 Tax=Anopheles arabiensis TaxID=7173 RepID=UPI001AAD5569|nr:stromal interaction molecule homolog isoform X4 [Anopheles arabiensis]
MRYFTRNFNAFACCCSLLLLPLGGLADVERGAPEAPAKAPIHQHQQHHPHQQPQSVKLHQPAVPSSAAYHQPAPGTGAAQHPDGPAPQQPAHYHQQAAAASASSDRSLSRQPPSSLAATSAPPRPLETRNSYTVLSQAMSQAVHHEFDFLFLISGTYGSGAMAGDAGSACTIDDIDCLAHHDQLGMEAIRSLHQQLDDDDNGDIDLSESDDFLREELKYDSGYEKRHKAFHFNDDMHISVKELWEAWLRSEVHNWTVDQTTEWLAQSVQLPQYVPLFRLHKVTGKVLPRLAVNNMHYVSNVLGIKDPIHKQKIALKAMDAVLFGPPRETGTRWKDLLLVTLLLTAIIGSWYAYHQNKSAKIHIRRMAKDVEGLLKAEVALKEMQKELEQARIEQENVGKEKMDLERRLREAPTLSSSSSDLELQQLKQEIEVLRSELNRAEVEIHDHCWTPPQGLQSWLQLTYELENKHHIRKRIMAEKQLEQAREACEKLRKKRSSLVGAFVSTHGKSIDDVDRSIVEARNALNDVTNDLQERMHRWKQIETMLGFGIVNNSGIAHLENLLYNRNGVAGKTYRSRLSSSQDDLDDDSVQASFKWPELIARTWSPWNPQRYLFHRQLQQSRRPRRSHRAPVAAASLLSLAAPAPTTSSMCSTSSSSGSSTVKFHSNSSSSINSTGRIYTSLLGETEAAARSLRRWPSETQSLPAVEAAAAAASASAPAAPCPSSTMPARRTRPCSTRTLRSAPGSCFLSGSGLPSRRSSNSSVSSSSSSSNNNSNSCSKDANSAPPGGNVNAQKLDDDMPRPGQRRRRHQRRRSWFTSSRQGDSTSNSTGVRRFPPTDTHLT